MALEVDIEHRYASGFSLAATLTAEPGVTAVVGPSGAGKSTLLSVVAGVVQPTRGRVVLNRRVLADSGRGIGLRPADRRLGVVFQEGLLFGHMSVESNLRYGMRRARGGPTLGEVVEALEIGELLAREPAALSGGQRQRVALGRALLSGPEALLLDEPASALEAPLRARVLDFVAQLADAHAWPTLLVTHDQHEAQRVAQAVVALKLAAD